MVKKIVFLLCVFMSFVLVGCGSENKEQTYKSNGVQVTMNEGFTEKSLASTTVNLESDEALFSALKETFDSLSAVGIDQNSTVEDYAKAVLANNQVDYEIQTKDDLTYFTYENEANGKTFFYLSSLYKADDAFWLINFACDKNNRDKYEILFLKWASTVKFE